MRSHEDRETALECLRIAKGDVDHATRMLAFVTGDDAAEKLAAVQEALK
jgi:hypothetical protein